MEETTFLMSGFRGQLGFDIMDRITVDGGCFSHDPRRMPLYWYDLAASRSSPHSHWETTNHEEEGCSRKDSG